MKINLEKLISDTKKENFQPDEKLYSAELSLVEETLIQSGYLKLNTELFNRIADFIVRYRLKCQVPGLALIGGTGCGKTEGVKRIAAILNLDFITAIQVCKAYGTEDYNRLVFKRNLITDRMNDLVIDEIGGNEPLEVVDFGTRCNVIAEVFQVRYDAFKEYGTRTIITTNLTMPQIKDRFGDRVESRFYEMFKLYSCSGNDLRKIKAAKHV